MPKRSMRWRQCDVSEKNGGERTSGRKRSSMCGKTGTEKAAMVRKTQWREQVTGMKAQMRVREVKTV